MSQPPYPNDEALRELLAPLPPSGSEKFFSALLRAWPWSIGQRIDGQLYPSVAQYPDGNYLLVFTHPQFVELAGASANFEAAEVPFQDLCRTVIEQGLAGVVVNPGGANFTIGRFAADLLADGIVPFDDSARLADDERLGAGPLDAPLAANVEKALRAAALYATLEELRVGTLDYRWQGRVPALFYRPFPNAAFETEAAKVVRRESLPPFASADLDAAAPAMPSLYARVPGPEGDTLRYPDDVSFRFLPPPRPLSPAFEADLREAARAHGLECLYVLGMQIGDTAPQLCFAYRPFPHDAFAARYTELHQKHRLGPFQVPLLGVDNLPPEALEAAVKLSG